MEKIIYWESAGTVYEGGEDAEVLGDHRAAVGVYRGHSYRGQTAGQCGGHYQFHQESRSQGLGLDWRQGRDRHQYWL